jgi:hypothetical protein
MEKVKDVFAGQYAPHIIGIIVAALFLTYWYFPRRPVRPVFVHPVRGQILLDGQPLPEAGIVLHPVNRSEIGLPGNVEPHARTDVDGFFALETYAGEDGAPDGNYVATVIQMDEMTDSDGEKSFGPNKLPALYSKPETSPFRVTISDELDELEPFELTSKAPSTSGKNSTTITGKSRR